MSFVFKKIALLFLYKIFFRKNNPSNSLMVLTYHRVSDKPELEDPLKVSLSTFEKQVLFLKKHYNIISAEQLSDLLRNGEPYPDNACLITFDDGWKDNYTNAYPILKKYNLPAVIFLSTDFIGTRKVFWPERLKQTFLYVPLDFDVKQFEVALKQWPQEISKKITAIVKRKANSRQSVTHELIVDLKSFRGEEIDRLIDEIEVALGSVRRGGKPYMLSWDEVREMSKDSISFGSHTKSHAILTGIKRDEVSIEIRESKNIIEQKIGKAVHFFAYPNGNYNEEILKIVREQGYLGSFTCLPGRNFGSTNSFELRRKHIREELSLGINGKFSELFFQIDLSDIRNKLKSDSKIQRY